MVQLYPPPKALGQVPPTRKSFDAVRVRSSGALPKLVRVIFCGRLVLESLTAGTGLGTGITAMPLGWLIRLADKNPAPVVMSSNIISPPYCVATYMVPYISTSIPLIPATALPKDRVTGLAPVILSIRLTVLG